MLMVYQNDEALIVKWAVQQCNGGCSQRNPQLQPSEQSTEGSERTCRDHAYVFAHALARVSPLAGARAHTPPRTDAHACNTHSRT